MRILTYTGLFPNEQRPTLGIFVLQRVSHFARRAGNQVQVVAPVPFFPSWIGWSRWSKEGQVPKREAFGALDLRHPRYLLIPKISMLLHGWLLFVGSWRTVSKLHRESAFDCIDAHFVYPDGFAAVLIGKLLRVPVVITARGTDINQYPGFPLVRPMIRWALRESAGIIAVSESLKQVIVALGISGEKVQVIGNGIDPARFHPVDPSVARQRVGLPPDAEVLVSVGGLIPRKGFHFLIPAFAKIAQSFPKLCLYILGEGEYRTELESLVRKANLQGRVFLPGAVPNEDLRFWFSTAKLSCLASSREGWPNVLQESLACGTPVVATRVWGAPEVIVSPNLGILVDQTVSSIAQGLEHAMQVPWDRDAIAVHARRRTWDVVALEMENYLQRSVHGSAFPAEPPLVQAER